MSDLQDFIKKHEINMAGYDNFKIGVLIQEARKKAGLTQEQLAVKIHTKKGNISRLENHSESVTISTLQRVANALGKKLKIELI